MLVLSRETQDKIVFPNLDITIEILKLSGRRVQLGVKAPDDIRVLRHELAETSQIPSKPARREDATNDQANFSHQYRNRLNAAHAALGLMEKQLNAGLEQKALATLRKATAIFDKLDAATGETLRNQARSSGSAVAPTPARATQADERTTDGVKPTTAKPKALLVEDDPNERELLTGYLEMCGFEVDTASDGVQAMIYLGRAQRPDIVLLDMHMPHMNGAETISTIREASELAGIRVLAVTGADPEEFSIPVGEEGVNRWVSKPVKPKHLVEIMLNELNVTVAP